MKRAKRALMRREECSLRKIYLLRMTNQFIGGDSYETPGFATRILTRKCGGCRWWPADFKDSPTRSSTVAASRCAQRSDPLWHDRNRNARLRAAERGDHDPRCRVCWRRRSI